LQNPLQLMRYLFTGSARAPAERSREPPGLAFRNQSQGLKSRLARFRSFVDALGLEVIGEIDFGSVILPCGIE
jgi:hypothetical protein